MVATRKRNRETDIDKEREQLFVEALTLLQTQYKKRHGHFPNTQENNELVDAASRVAKGYQYGAVKI